MNLANAPLRTMEPAIIERLRLAFPAKTFAIERVPSVMTVKEFERVYMAAPFIGLSWTGLRSAKNNSRQLQAAWEWALTLVYKSAGGPERRYAGDQFGIGHDAMFDVAVALLQGAEIPRIGWATVTGAQAAYAEGHEDQDTVVARIDFEISTTVTPAAFSLKTVDDFSRFGIAWMTGEPADPPHQPDIRSELGGSP